MMIIGVDYHPSFQNAPTLVLAASTRREQRPRRGRRELWLYGCLRRYMRLVPPQAEARSESNDRVQFTARG
jgi:hypothetical protein